MQRAIPPGQVFVSLVAKLWRHIVSAVQRSEDTLDTPGADVVPAHQVVDQLAVVATGAHRTSHDVCFSPLSSIITSADHNCDVTVVFQHIFLPYSRHKL